MTEQPEELPDFVDVDLENLEEITLDEIKANIPKVFMKPSDLQPDVAFDFLLNNIKKVKVIPRMKTRVGIQDMYVLDTVPQIRCFRNALTQLENFVEKNKIKLPATIHYETRTGADFDTVYIFEKV